MCITAYPSNLAQHLTIWFGITDQSKLIQYCGHGKLNIGNNLAEDAIRFFAIVRKNYFL
ncbi:MAG: transposase [Pseudomonadales bacterium]|nr:transposase [Pseudomonadales bacterium]